MSCPGQYSEPQLSLAPDVASMQMSILQSHIRGGGFVGRVTGPVDGEVTGCVASVVDFVVPVTGFEVPVTVFVVSVIGFVVSVTGFEVPVTGFEVSVTGFEVSVTGFEVSVTVLVVSVSGFDVPVIGFEVSVTDLVVSVTVVVVGFVAGDVDFVFDGVDSVTGNVLHSSVEKHSHGFALCVRAANAPVGAWSICSTQFTFCFCAPLPGIKKIEHNSST